MLATIGFRGKLRGALEGSPCLCEVVRAHFHAGFGYIDANVVFVDPQSFS